MCLQTVVKISPALKRLRQENLPYFEGLIPSDKQLDSFAEMLSPLLVIKKTSEILERETKPTLHMVLPLIMKISTISRSTLFQTSSNTTRAIIEAFEAGLAMRVKDHGRSIPAVCLANYLHPSYKGSLLNEVGKFYFDETEASIKELFPEVNPESQSQATVRRVNISFLAEVLT